MPGTSHGQMRLLPSFLRVSANLTEKSPPVYCRPSPATQPSLRCPLPDSSAPTARLAAADRDELVAGLLSVEQVSCGPAYRSNEGGDRVWLLWDAPPWAGTYV